LVANFYSRPFGHIATSANLASKQTDHLMFDTILCDQSSKFLAAGNTEMLLARKEVGARRPVMYLSDHLHSFSLRDFRRLRLNTLARFFLIL